MARWRTPASRRAYDGLGFPPCGADELAGVLRPAQCRRCPRKRWHGEVISSLKRDGKPVDAICAGGLCGVQGADATMPRPASSNMGCRPTQWRYAAMYKPFHLIGLNCRFRCSNVAAARRADGSCRRLARRRGGGRQARAESRRDARREGAIRSMPSPFRRRAASRSAACRSGSPITSSSSVTWRGRIPWTARRRA